MYKSVYIRIMYLSRRYISPICCLRKLCCGARELWFRMCIFLLCICLDGIFGQSVVYVGSAAVCMCCDLECVFILIMYLSWWCILPFCCLRRLCCGAHEVCFRVWILVLCICLHGVFGHFVVSVGSAPVSMTCYLECVYFYYVFG